jgi:hypothetical protein
MNNNIFHSQQFEINRDIICNWLNQYEFVGVKQNCEFVIFYINHIEYYFDFTIQKSYVCCTFDDNYMTRNKFIDIESINEVYY